MHILTATTTPRLLHGTVTSTAFVLVLLDTLFIVLGNGFIIGTTVLARSCSVQVPPKASCFAPFWQLGSFYSLLDHPARLYQTPSVLG